MKEQSNANKLPHLSQMVFVMKIDDNYSIYKAPNEEVLLQIGQTLKYDDIGEEPIPLESLHFIIDNEGFCPGRFTVDTELLLKMNGEGGCPLPWLLLGAAFSYNKERAVEENYIRQETEKMSKKLNNYAPVILLLVILVFFIPAYVKWFFLCGIAIFLIASVEKLLFQSRMKPHLERLRNYKKTTVVSFSSPGSKRT